MGGLDVVEARLHQSAQVIDHLVPGHARVPNCDRQFCLVQDALVELDQEADELRVLLHQVADDPRLALNVTRGKLDVLDARLRHSAQVVDHLVHRAQVEEEKVCASSAE
eukprot:12146929-Heterocapsa_arctica.AAC.1